MKKSKKVLLIVGLILLVSFAAFIVVALQVWPETTKEYLNTAWEWLNTPLPVVGVSVLMVLYFLWQVFKYSSFGKKQINEFKKNCEDTKSEFDAYKEYCDEKLEEQKQIISEQLEMLEHYKKAFKELCNTIPNKKVNMLGEKYYGEEVNNETEAN